MHEHPPVESIVQWTQVSEPQRPDHQARRGGAARGQGNLALRAEAADLVREQHQVGDPARADRADFFGGARPHFCRWLTPAGLGKASGQRVFDELGEPLLVHLAGRLEAEQQGRAKPLRPRVSQFAAGLGQPEGAALGDLDAGLQRGRHLSEQPPHLLRRFQVGLRASRLDGDRRQVVAIASVVAKHSFSARPTPDRLEERMGECVFRTSESDAAGRNHRELHALSERHQSAIDQFFGRVPMEGELQVQPVRIQLHQAARESQRLDRFGWIRGMFDGRGQDAPTAWHASQGYDALIEFL